MMVYSALAGLIIFIALVVVLAAGRLLFKGNWFMGWIRGMSGAALFALSVILVFAALDFYSYKQLSKEQSVANISFTQLEPQRYNVSLVDSDGIEYLYELNGDLWQLDARIIKWNQKMAGLGLTPGYRLDRLSGRFYALEDEHEADRTVYDLGESRSALDIWAWLRDHGKKLSIIDAQYGSATYLPMADGALFAVSLSSTGLLARPLNDRAKSAVENWQ